MVGVRAVRIRNAKANLAVFAIRHVVIDVRVPSEIAVAVVVAVTCEAQNAVACRIVISLHVVAVVAAAPIVAVQAECDVMSFSIKQMLIFRASVKAHKTAVVVAVGVVMVAFDAACAIFVAEIVLPAVAAVPVRETAYPYRNVVQSVDVILEIHEETAADALVVTASGVIGCCGGVKHTGLSVGILKRIAVAVVFRFVVTVVAVEIHVKCNLLVGVNVRHPR